MHLLRLVRRCLPDGVPGARASPALAAEAARLRQLQFVRFDLSGRRVGDDGARISPIDRELRKVPHTYGILHFLDLRLFQACIRVMSSMEPLHMTENGSAFTTRRDVGAPHSRARAPVLGELWCTMEKW